MEEEMSKIKCGKPVGKRSPREKKTQKVEEITFISSDEERCLTSSSQEFSSSSSSDEPWSGRRRRGAKKKVGKREIVVPPPFVLDGRLKLKEYLTMFETYFNTKFCGNSHDMCQHLENFLQGELLKVYHVYGGRLIKYKKMKEKLLAFYQTLKIGGKSYWKAQLESCTLNHGEALDLYGMRLLGIAELAFPQSKRECAAQVRRKFLGTIPRTISARISDAERAVKAFSGGKKKHLSYASMMEMAKELQEESPQIQSVMWSERSGVNDYNPPVTPPRGQVREYRRSQGGGARGYSPRTRVQSENGSNFNLGVARIYCSFCGKKNHQVENCWRANQSCLICGGQHFMKDCSQFQPNFKNERSPQSNSKASVPRRRN